MIRFKFTSPTKLPLRFQDQTGRSQQAQTAERLAARLTRDLRSAYSDWLQETVAEIEQAENDAVRDIIAAAIALLLARVKARSRQALNELALELDANDAMLAAMEEQMERTLDTFEQDTAPRLQSALVATANEAAIGIRDGTVGEAILSEHAGKAATVALVGGITWTAYQAAKRAKTTGDPPTRWAGPNDASTCGPCSREVNAGVRPLSATPLPGPDVCQGLTNCRHEIEVMDEVTGIWRTWPA